MIPKIAHFYWGNSILPYIRYLSIKSFAKFNPDYKIYIYKSKETNNKVYWKTGELDYPLLGKDYSDKIEFTYIEDLQFKSKSLEFKSIPEVHKADLFRFYILSTVGGIWSDTDIIFFKPVQIVNKSMVCLHKHHSMGFLWSIENCEVYKKAYDFALKHYNINHYQGAGPNLMNQFMPVILKHLYNLPLEVVYPYSWREVDLLYSNDLSKIKENTIGIHWFGGYWNHERFINELTEENVLKYNHVLGEAIKRSLA